MTMAPSINELKSRQYEMKTSEGETPMNVETSPTGHIDLSQGFTKVGIIGAGGAGKSAAIRSANVLSPDTTRIITMDTSGVDFQIPNVTSFKIKNLKGSGKFKAENYDPISNFVTDWVTKNQFEDVTIIVQSLAGGSGSVIGSLLFDEIVRQGKIAIMIGIVDTDSEVDTINSFNSIRSYINLTEDRKAYLPTILFDNNKGRSVVDHGIDDTIQSLVTILTTDYIGLDKQDRVNFLNPNTFNGVTFGMKLLCVSKDISGDWNKTNGQVYVEVDTDKLDSVMSISEEHNHINLIQLCTVTFRGYFAGNGQEFIVSNGYQIPQEFIAGLNDRIHSFKSVTETKKTSFESEHNVGTRNSKGLIL